MYVDTRTQTWPRSPGSNVATHTQSCCFPGVAALQSVGSKSTLMSVVPGVAPRSCTLPLAVQMSLHCLWLSTFNLACLLQNSTGIPLVCAATRAHSWAPLLGLWACMLFSFPHSLPCMWNEHLGTKRKESLNERRNLSQLNAPFAEGKTHIPWAPNWATNSEAGLLILVLWPHFFVFFHELMGSEGIRLAKMPKTEPGGLAER